MCSWLIGGYREFFPLGIERPGSDSRHTDEDGLFKGLALPLCPVPAIGLGHCVSGDSLEDSSTPSAAKETGANEEAMEFNEF